MDHRVQQGTSGRGDADSGGAWADGDRAFARSADTLDGVAAGHPNANIAPAMGYAECDDVKPLRLARDDRAPALEFSGVAATTSTHAATLPADSTYDEAMRAIETLRAACANRQDECEQNLSVRGEPSGDSVNEETPGVWERVVRHDGLLLAALVVLLCVYVFSLMMMGGAGKADPYARVLPAIIEVESGGDAAAVGDGGRAVGILQIHPITVEDANRIARLRKLKDSFTLDDRTDAVKSRAMFRLVSDHYSRGKSDEVVARRWNGGPKGETKAATAGYWAKVKAKMSGGGK